MMINHIMTSSLVIVFVLLIGTIFENKISACLKYSLWLLVVIKLLLPFQGFESRFHILNFVEFCAEAVSDGLENMADEKLPYEESVAIDNSLNNEANHSAVHNLDDDFYAEIKGNQETEITKEDIGEMKTNNLKVLSMMVKVVYFTGVIVCFAAICISNLRFYKAFKVKRKYVDTYKDQIHVYRIEEYYGACLYGGFSPVIIVGNNTSLSMEQQDMILLHEYVHYAHGDHIWSMIRNLCVALYWYNPLVWLAASVSRKDSELACDEGTIRRIEETKRITYGQTLLEVVAKASKKNSLMSAVFLNSTTATRGKEEMKKRISVIAKGRKTSRVALILTIVLSVACIGCTFGEPINENRTEELSAISENKEVVSDIDETEKVMEDNTLDVDKITQKYSNVYTNPQKGKICILIQPSELREQLNYYYIPENKVQEELKQLLDDTKLLSEEEQGKTKGKRGFTCSWSLEYDDKQYQVFENGYMLGTDMESFEILFFEQNLELIDKINNLLEQELNYGVIDISTISNLTSATLSVKDFRTNHQLYEQMITDDDKLKNLEVWFSNAKRVSGAYDCGNNGAALLLKTASGQEIKISLAADDCPIFAINGIYYDYRPADKITEGWYSNHVFDMFEQIPNAFEEELSLVENKYVWPTESTAISNGFGERMHPITGELKMIDYLGIAGKTGDSVYAVSNGYITDVGFDNALGNYIVLSTATDEEVIYGHLDGSKVAVGDQVKAGDMIGMLGQTGNATGPFLSISVKVKGEAVDPIPYFSNVFIEEIITYNGKEYKKSELSNATLQWLELSEKDRMLSSYFPPEFMIFDEKWGVSLTIENLTSSGAIIKCTQADGEPTGELHTGSWYILETWTQDNGWKEMPYVIDGEIGWNDVAWIISMDDTTEIEVNWEWLYGKLPTGKYRIGKEITDFRSSGDFDTAIYYAEFEIK
ncbi:MAG: peptidoglycan DD-metalloendopeptidase family protein [Lachnospiraceae bacterium]|nr:peptidoglycan DD-metalloendopeptidase family protein [Lachnospiraceae bacterium]